MKEQREVLILDRQKNIEGEMIYEMEEIYA